MAATKGTGKSDGKAASVSRRSLLKGSATAAVLAAAKSLVPGGATVAWAAGPEQRRPCSAISR